MLSNTLYSSAFPSTYWFVSVSVVYMVFHFHNLWQIFCLNNNLWLSLQILAMMNVGNNMYVLAYTTDEKGLRSLETCFQSSVFLPPFYVCIYIGCVYVNERNKSLPSFFSETMISGQDCRNQSEISISGRTVRARQLSSH